jgi:hypothetical protein
VPGAPTDRGLRLPVRRSHRERVTSQEPPAVPPVDRVAIDRELEAASAALHELLTGADAAALRRPSDGTRWTNEELLFHMVLGYGVVRVLLPLVRLVGRLPAPVGRGWAALLNAAARPFHRVNYWGPAVVARVLSPARIDALRARAVAGLRRSLQRETEAALHRGMPMPTRWDPYFREWMSLAEVYRYATTHVEHHRRQLTLAVSDRPVAGRDAAGGSGHEHVRQQEIRDGRDHDEPIRTAQPDDGRPGDVPPGARSASRRPPLAGPGERHRWRGRTPLSWRTHGA